MPINFSLHPNVYSTSHLVGLRSMLEHLWVRTHSPGDGTFFIISGFGNYNGGARFYRTFKEHTENGGQIVAFFSGSTSQRITSRQVVEALLECGVVVNVINRKRLMHAKCYGVNDSEGESIIVTSGNFTGPGMVQNVEAAVLLENDITPTFGFSWNNVVNEMLSQGWMVYQPDLTDLSEPGWKLLYDETPGIVPMDESEAQTIIVMLGHADTARIQALPGSNAGKGSQYFWLSKDSFDFFPPLTIRNARGMKGTLSALVTLHYIDIGITDNNCRVTFEAENNLDFRLGTGKLRYTQVGNDGDMACITRIGEAEYELRIIKSSDPKFAELLPYAINFIGHQGKKYGFLSNSDFLSIYNQVTT